MNLVRALKGKIEGKVTQGKKTLERYSTDASIFSETPTAVVFPKKVADIATLVRFVSTLKDKYPKLSLTARAAGTDMGGGPLTESVVVAFTKYFNHFSIRGKTATVEPGVYYRDFEKATHKHGLELPSYPASKSIAALGGMLANNSGGEKTLRYGKTNKYVRSLKVVLSDGNTYTLKKLTQAALKKKMAQRDFEGTVYRKTYHLLEKHYDAVQKARPNVSKNSAGYALWDVWDKQYFDLTQLFVGSQGTLGLIAQGTLELIPVKTHRRLGVLYLKSIDQLPDLVNKLIPLKPESLETFDDATLKLALRFLPEIAQKVPGLSFWQLLAKFIPDALIGVRMLGIPKLIILVEFAEDEESLVHQKLDRLGELAHRQGVPVRLIRENDDAEAYWTVRRQSFNLLRKHVADKQATPFVDDFIVQPKYLPKVLPKIYDILDSHGIHATLAGHAGSGNFPIIPIMNLSERDMEADIFKVADEVYNVVLAYHGSITAEHNDGLIRSPYLEKMYGKEIYGLFQEVKKIFDPKNIFNPGKKVNASRAFAEVHVKTRKNA